MKRVSIHVFGTSIEALSEPPVRQEYEGLDGLREAFSVLLLDPAVASVTEFDLVLHSPLAQIRTLHGIPPVSPVHLESIVRDGIYRFFRLPDGDAVVTAAWAQLEGTEVVRAAAIGAQTLDDLDAAIVDVGGVITGCQVDDPQKLATLELLPASTRAARRRSNLRHMTVSGAMLILGLLLPSVVYSMDLFSDLKRLEREQQALGTSLGQIAAIDSALSGLRPIVAALGTLVDQDVHVSRWLRAVAATLPDSAYLTSLQIDSTTIRLEVVAADALEVRALFEAGGFYQPRIEAPPTVEASDGRALERFILLMDDRK
jgi:hypothetical protein